MSNRNEALLLAAPSDRANEATHKPVITGVKNIPGRDNEIGVSFTYPDTVGSDSPACGMPPTSWRLDWKLGDGPSQPAYTTFTPGASPKRRLITNSAIMQEGVTITVTPLYGYACEGTSSDPYPVNPNPQPTERLPLCWIDAYTSNVMRADPDYTEGGVFKDPVAIGKVSNVGLISSATRLRTDGEMILYWLDSWGRIWAGREQFPRPGLDVQVPGDFSTLVSITTFGDLTGDGNEDLIGIGKESPDTHLNPVTKFNNLGFGQLSPSAPTNIPPVGNRRTNPAIAGRGNHPDGDAPWIIGNTQVTSAPLTFSQGIRNADGEVTFESRNIPPYYLPYTGLRVPTGISLGDSDGDGIPDILTVTRDTAGNPRLALIPMTTDPAAPLAPYRFLDNLGSIYDPFLLY